MRRGRATWVGFTAEVGPLTAHGPYPVRVTTPFPRRFLAVALVIVASAALLPVFAAQAQAASEPSVAATVTVGTNPNSIAITPDGTKAVVANYGSASVSIIDIASATSSTVSVGASPIAVAISPDGTEALVCNFLSNSVSRISLINNTVVDTLSLGGGARPASVIYSLDGTKAFVSEGGLGINLIAQITMSSFTVTDSLTATLPSSLVLSPNGDRAYTTAAVSSYVTYFSTSTLTSGSIVLTGYSGASASSLAVSPDGATVYAVREGPGNIVSILNAVTLTEASITVVGTSPRDVAVSPDGSKVYVTNNGSGNVSALNAAGAVTDTITVGSGPNQVAFTPDGSYALVTNDSSNSVSFINTSSRSVEATVPVGANPQKLAITPLGTKALVLNYDAGTVSIINAPINEVVGGPTASIQQYAIRQGDSCGVNVPNSVLLPAFGEASRNSNWGNSWAQWPNNGLGGYVCTRQPLYTTSGWLIAP